MNFLTILTPTYNRESFLENIYNSLLNQDLTDFTWLVIDDGSSDSTKLVMKQIISNHVASFNIQFVVKENGGKHSALNFSHDYLDSEYVVVLDSDDIMRKNSVSLIKSYIENYDDDNRKFTIGWFAFLRGNRQEKLIDIRYKHHLRTMDYITYLNEGRKGECCDVYSVEVFKKFPYPLITGEKFVSESYLNIVAAVYGRYKMVTVNEIVQLSEYQSDGLTKQGRKLQLLSPKGNAELWRNVGNKPFSIKMQLKGVLLYTTYSLVGKVKLQKIIKHSVNPQLCIILLPFSFLLNVYWTRKYLKGEKND